MKVVATSMCIMGRKPQCSFNNTVLTKAFPELPAVVGIVLGGCHVLLLVVPPLHQELGVVSVL